MISSFRSSTISNLGSREQYPSNRVVIRQARTLRFSGALEDAEANRQALNQKLTLQKEKTSRQAYAKHYFTLGNKKIFGKDLLHILQALSTTHKRDWIQCYEIYAVLYPDTHLQERDTSTLSKALKKLVDAGCLAAQKTDEGYLGKHEYQFTDIGKALVGLTETMPSAQQATLKPGVNAAVGATAPRPPERIQRIRFLMSPQGEHLTGWDILKKVEATEEGRSYFDKIWSSGIHQSQLVQALSVLEADKVLAKLREMMQIGLLSMNPHGSNPSKNRWLLSPMAKELLTYPNPVKACKIENQDLKTLLELELKELTDEEKNRLEQLSTLETQFKKALTECSQKESQIPLQEAETLALYEKSQAATDPAERENLEFEASRTMQKLNSTKKLLILEKQMLEELKGQLKASKILYQTWLKQAQEKSDKLNEALLKLKSANMFSDFFGMMKKLDVLGGVVQKVENFLAPVFDNVQTNYYTTQAAIINEQSQEALEQLETETKLELMEAISELKEKKAKRDEKTGSDVLGTLAKDAPYPQARRHRP